MPTLWCSTRCRVYPGSMQSFQKKPSERTANWRMYMALVLVFSPSSIYVLSGSISWRGRAFYWDWMETCFLCWVPAKVSSQHDRVSDLDLTLLAEELLLWRWAASSHCTRRQGTKRTACWGWEASQEPYTGWLLALLWEDNWGSWRRPITGLNLEG